MPLKEIIYDRLLSTDVLSENFHPVQPRTWC
jgi:hypothetical protein